MDVVQVAFWTVALLVILAVAFDFMNGFHDAANSIATVVSTGVLKPQQAVLFAAFFNVIAISVFQLKVAATIGKGIVEPGIVDHHVVFGALIGAIVWNVITWWYGIPSSSSHALIGGIVGAVTAKAGLTALVGAGIWKAVAFIFVSPALGFLLGSLLMVVVAWIFRRVPPLRVDRWFRRLQLVSAGLYSLGHGGNDAQKTIGIIWMLLVASGYVAASDKMPPSWVIWTCYIAIGLGTMFGGVIDDLGDNDRLRHLNRPLDAIIVPLHFDPFRAVDFGHPLDQALAGVTEGFRQLGKGHGRCPFGIAIGLAGADARKVRCFRSDEMFECIPYGAI